MINSFLNTKFTNDLPLKIKIGEQLYTNEHFFIDLNYRKNAKEEMKKKKNKGQTTSNTKLILNTMDDKSYIDNTLIIP